MSLKNHLIPEVPDEPELPLVPDEPLEPSTPEVPDEPDEPEVPEEPELPEPPPPPPSIRTITPSEPLTSTCTPEPLKLIRELFFDTREPVYSISVVTKSSKKFTVSI